MREYKHLRSKLFAMTCVASLILTFTACKKDESLTIANEKELTQTAFADEENTGKGFTFTAKSDWTATVKEVSNQKSSGVSWLKLLYNGIETYNSGAGTFTLEISIEPNFTGQKRSATIEIVSGKDKITITVTQAGTTQSGEVITSISLDIVHLSLVVGEVFPIDVTFLPMNVSNSTISTVVWTSSDSNIVHISNNGIVTAITIGNAIITAQVGDKTADLHLSVKDGVRLNGLLWAKYNVDAFGVFTQSPEMAGKFYQWGRSVAWSTTGNITNWNSAPQTNNSWIEINDPCPEGWRIPTMQELQASIGQMSHILTTINGVNGRLFGDAPSQIFLPFVGYRDPEDGSLKEVGISGYYWSSQYIFTDRARSFYIYDDPRFEGTGESESYRLSGHCIRCIAKE